MNEYILNQPSSRPRREDRHPDLGPAFPPLAEPEGKALLTECQYEIAELLAKGQSRKQIGSRLGIKIGTVNAHIRDAGRKLPGRGAYAAKMVAYYARREGGAST